MRACSGRGFTLIEMAVVVAIIAIVSTAAFSALSRHRPRASLASTSAELQSLIHFARQTALGSGQDVVVMIFPNYASSSTSTGRVIVYRDGTFDFFTGGATGGVSFSTYSASTLTAGSNGEILATLDLPRDVTFGPTTGMGASATLPAPFSGILVNSACSFCSTSTTDQRGAIKFNSRGAPSFYGAGTDLDTAVTVTGGASLTLQSSDVSGQHTLIVTTPAGAIQVIKNG